MIVFLWINGINGRKRYSFVHEEIEERNCEKSFEKHPSFFKFLQISWSIVKTSSIIFFPQKSQTISLKETLNSRSYSNKKIVGALRIYSNTKGFSFFEAKATFLRHSSIPAVREIFDRISTVSGDWDQIARRNHSQTATTISKIYKRTTLIWIFLQLEILSPI